MELKVRIHQEDGSYWAEVEELPGCFASGQTLDELVEALHEAVELYLGDTSPKPPLMPVTQVQRMEVLV